MNENLLPIDEHMIFFTNMFIQKATKDNNIEVINEELIKETALRTLHIESMAIERLRTSINAAFIECVQLIYQSKGRLIVSGIGKSALIAQKIVATLNSTGTPAIFMHAADAIHGDLGMVRQDDIMLCLSKSGETSEIKVLVPLVKSRGNHIIAMAGRKTSYLATHADYLLYTPIDQEADPNNLAPTASTTAQAAMGDALATALLAVRGFSPSDFAQFHPGGALGKQLYLRVRDLYIQNERPAILADADIRQTILEMTSKRLGCTVVINEAEHVLGIITDGDLRRMLEKHQQFESLHANQIMTPGPKVINADEMAVAALELMRSNSITQLIVVDEAEKYLGILHLHDLIREGLI